MPRKSKRGPKPPLPPKPGELPSPPTSPESPDPPSSQGITTTTTNHALAMASSCDASGSLKTPNSGVAMATKSVESSVIDPRGGKPRPSLVSADELDKMVEMNLPEAIASGPSKSFSTNLSTLKEATEAVEKSEAKSQREVVLGSDMMVRTGVVTKTSSKVIKCSFTQEQTTGSRDVTSVLTDVWEESEPASPEHDVTVPDVGNAAEVVMPLARSSSLITTSLDDITIATRLQEALDYTRGHDDDDDDGEIVEDRRVRKPFIRAESSDRRGSFFIKNTFDTDDPDAPLHSFEIGSANYDDYEVDAGTREDDINTKLVNDSRDISVIDTDSVAMDQENVMNSRTVAMTDTDADGGDNSASLREMDQETGATFDPSKTVGARSDIERQIEDAMNDETETGGTKPHETADRIPESLPESDYGTGKKKKRQKPAMGVEILVREKEGTEEGLGNTLVLQQNVEPLEVRTPDSSVSGPSIDVAAVEVKLSEKTFDASTVDKVMLADEAVAMEYKSDSVDSKFPVVQDDREKNVTDERELPKEKQVSTVDPASKHRKLVRNEPDSVAGPESPKSPTGLSLLSVPGKPKSKKKRKKKKVPTATLR